MTNRPAQYTTFSGSRVHLHSALELQYGMTAICFSTYNRSFLFATGRDKTHSQRPTARQLMSEVA
jgi:hypothetical protein